MTTSVRCSERRMAGVLVSGQPLDRAGRRLPLKEMYWLQMFLVFKCDWNRMDICSHLFFCD